MTKIILFRQPHLHIQKNNLMKKTLIYDISIFVLVMLVLLLVNIPYLNILLAFLIVMMYAYAHQGLKDTLGFSAQKNILELVATAIVLAIGIVLVTFFIILKPVENLTGYSLQLGVFEQIKGNFSVYLSSLTIGWIVGGFMEEVIFRGFMISKFMNLLGEKTGAVIGIIFSSCLFGYLHAYQGITGQLLTGFAGFIFALTYILSKRNLWLAILTHGFVNTVSMTLLYFDLLR